ncbi:MAG: DegT/DnrJ/EryC1/StrS aminotransferase [Candidatus Altiarchaeales archaeon]|nr:MAG: DegT/DnrJ/EryC1/StrS aminotransferase [Candidatus Asgardarchaeum californiense]RLI93305.1 MAG: DegT/DnrJ/EryC1/StrS aminotransferase [Candidatus Altiarchaeales archaeon]HDO82523.1 DegT/DnrJ/EryC1/StrS family aminotransferase [Candidatus Altiarchaeales archaeon]HEX55172.1 DegT/DnrJ/EryC1/StrS family aminotransferase [Candidatus Altiarchaeales archaeon]
MQWKIPLSDIDLGEEEIDAVVKVLKSKWLSMGPITEKFENTFAEYLNVKHAFAVSSGTAALHIANIALGIGRGDEVILPSLTFVATSNSVLYAGAKPVFADITSYDDFTISPDDIQNKITSRTKAIIVVHYGGYMCDMNAILEIAQDYGVFVIEDSAHAVGAEISGRKAGTIGDIGCFSFFSNKNLVTGEGGMIVTNNDEIAEKIKSIRSHGMTILTWDRHRGYAHSYDVINLGFNYRLNEMASAIGLAQLKKLDENNRKRMLITEKYKKLLRRVYEIYIPFNNYRGKPSYHIFPILLSDEIPRQEFMEKLKEKGIQTSIHYPPIHLFTYYRKLGFRERLQKTEYVGKHEVTLPLYPMLEDSDIEYIVDMVYTTIQEMIG